MKRRSFFERNKSTLAMIYFTSAVCVGIGLWSWQYFLGASLVLVGVVVFKSVFDK